VRAVFQGHIHGGDYAQVNGIHYCTMKAMVVHTEPPNNAYSIVVLDQAGGMTIKGYGREATRAFSASTRDKGEREKGISPIIDTSDELW